MLGLGELDGEVEGLVLGLVEGEEDGEAEPALTTVATRILTAPTTPVDTVTFVSNSWPVVGMVNPALICWLAPVTVAPVTSVLEFVISTSFDESAAFVASWEYL